MIIMDAFQVYKYYLALKLHFTTDKYDVIKQKGKVRASRQAFAKRSDLFAINKIAKKYSVPVIVDAAAQLPPLSNLWQFTSDEGADLAIFSGGKALRGPQSSGLIVGKREFIEAVRVNWAPNQGLGRGFKASKEEIAGLLTAIELYIAKDHEGAWRKWSATVDEWVASLSGSTSCSVFRDDINEAGQPVPRVAIKLPDNSALDIVAKLQKLDPIVEVVHNSRAMVWISPDSLQPGEEPIVIEQLKKVLPRK